MSWRKKPQFSWSSCKMWYSPCFHRKYPKIAKNAGLMVRKIFLGPCHEFRLKYIVRFPPEIWLGSRICKYFDHCSIVEELSVYFRCTSGKIEFSNCLKVKELCPPRSFYQFKHILSKEVVYLRLIVSKELLDSQSSLDDECLMTDARCHSMLLFWSSENGFSLWCLRVIFLIKLLYSG